MRGACIIDKRFITAKRKPREKRLEKQAQRISFASSRRENEISRARFLHSQTQYLVSFSVPTEKHILKIWPGIIVASTKVIFPFSRMFSTRDTDRTNGAEMIEHSIYIPSCSNFAFEHTIFLNTRVTLCEISRSRADLFCQE